MPQPRSFDSVFKQPIQPHTPQPYKESEQGWWALFKSFFLAVLLALVFRSVLFEPYWIPSGSMMPTLLVNDYLFVSKFSYGISRYSFPFAPRLFEGRIGMIHSPQRGDVVVFKGPRPPHTTYIKRLIGLPGDRVQMKEGRLYLNGELVERTYEGTFHDGGHTLLHYQEILPGSIEHSTLDMVEHAPTDNTEEFIVPAKHYFFMGDNRDNSNDSRAGIGFVPEENLLGKATVVFFSSEDRIWKLWTWPLSMRFKRMFKTVEQL